MSAAQRIELYGEMREMLGIEPAATLMEILPPMSSSDIATRADVDSVAVALRGEMIELRSELRGEMDREFGALRADFGELRGKFKVSTRHTIITIVAAALTTWLTFYVPTVL